MSGREVHGELAMQRFGVGSDIPVSLPEASECLLNTGLDADFQLKVVVRNMDHDQEQLLSKLTRIEGVTGGQSSFVLRKVLNRSALPMSRESH